MLDHAAWTHILSDHSDLELDAGDILRAVEAPSRHMPGRRQGEEWFYAQGVGPSRWLKVVVHYEQGGGRIVTAFARRALP